MTINTCENNDQFLLASYQASLDCMFVQAKILYNQGNLHKIGTLTTRVHSKSVPLRVQSVEI